MECKVLFDSHAAGIEKSLRAWLQQRQGRIRIYNVAADANYYGKTVALLYQPEDGPEYNLSVISSRRHTELEEQINQVLASVTHGSQVITALGSNQLGHCLFLFHWVEK